MKLSNLCYLLFVLFVCGPSFMYIYFVKEKLSIACGWKGKLLHKKDSERKKRMKTES